MRRLRDCRGMVTAEVAVLLPAMVLLLVVALRAIGAGVAELQCVDAARAGARAAARGESPSLAREAALAVAPGGARVEIVTVGDRVRVTVTAAASLLPWAEVPLLATAVARLEQDP